MCGVYYSESLKRQLNLWESVHHFRHGLGSQFQLELGFALVWIQGAHYAVLAGPELVTILLPALPEYWDDRSELAHTGVPRAFIAFLR